MARNDEQSETIIREVRGPKGTKVLMLKFAPWVITGLMGIAGGGLAGTALSKEDPERLRKIEGLERAMHEMAEQQNKTNDKLDKAILDAATFKAERNQDERRFTKLETTLDVHQQILTSISDRFAKKNEYDELARTVRDNQARLIALETKMREGK